jgi:hypothetical protein
LSFLITIGINREKIKRPREKNIFPERRLTQWLVAHTSLTVPTMKVKIRVPAGIARPPAWGPVAGCPGRGHPTPRIPALRLDGGGR